jgi:hypothetical protein
VIETVLFSISSGNGFTDSTHCSDSTTNVPAASFSLYL